MKTTLIVRDDLYRKAKALAALQGKSLSRFFEESLECMLKEESKRKASWSEWATNLPSISHQASRDLADAVASPDFRSVDPEMWP